jgi:amidohydrolase
VEEKRAKGVATVAESLKGHHLLGAQLLAEAEELSEKIVGWRREFHQFPELAFEENVTASRVAQVLETLPGMTVHRSFGVATAVLAVLGEDLPGPALMLRCGMDALALDEETGLPFASCIPGIMHACGHDGHMAALLGAAILLSDRREELKRPVLFLFQPAEEGRAGAKALVAAGLFERFSIGLVLGIYFRPHLPFGVLSLRPGTMTALSDRIHIEIEGTGGHAASPHTAIDTVTIGAHLLLAIQNVVSREIDPQETVVISFGQIEAGDAYNVIPKEAHLWGTLRAFKREVRDHVQERLEAMIPLLARAYRASAHVEYARNYPSVENDPEKTAVLFERAKVFFGDDAVDVMDRPVLSGEDFSFYGDQAPTVFMFLGTGAEFDVNHPKNDVPEEILPLASAWQAFLALTF